MTYGPQQEYRETDHNVSMYLQDPENDVRREVDRIISSGGSGTHGVIDGGTP